jgi:hypothetical protein
MHTSHFAPRRFVTNKGVERFEIVKVIQEKPVLLCEVEVLDEDDDDTEQVSCQSTLKHSAEFAQASCLRCRYGCGASCWRAIGKCGTQAYAAVRGGGAGQR